MEKELNYVIKNHKNLYIRLNENGKPVTCSERERGVFEYSKAKNILDNLQKTLKKLNFKVEPIPENIRQKGEEYKEVEKKVIYNENYVIPDTILRWVEKFGICDDILKEAEIRKKELIQIISSYDRSISNWLHSVELEKKKNACAGYKKYSDVKDIVDKRRCVKDELMIINNVLKMDFRELDRDIVHKTVIGLAKRKFAYRIVEEDETKSVV